MRKLSVFVAAGLLALGISVPATSGTLTLTGSTLAVTIGTLPSIVVQQGTSAIPIVVSSGSGGFVLPAGIFQSSVVIPTQLFTGVSLISSLNVSAIQQTITVPGTGPLGSAQGVVGGSAVVGVLGGLLNLNIPLNVGGTGTIFGGAAALEVTVVNMAGWTTGAAKITGITVGTGTKPTGTETLTGSDNRTAGHNGSMTLVNPTKVITNAAGNLALFTVLHLNFRGAQTPEPATLLLLGSGMVGLVALGRRKLRK